MKRLFAVAIGIGVAACGGAPPIPADAQRVVVSLDRIDCSDCGDRIVTDLRSRPGVYQASFDRKLAEIRVVASPSFDVFTTVRQLSAAAGFEAILGAGKGHYLEGPKFPEGADVKLIATGGADVPDLEPVLAKGKVTVIDFSATWCGPCRQIDQHMVSVLGDHTEVAYRKIEIGDWETPVAKHYLKRVPQLPYVIVFDAMGAKIAELSGVDLEGLDTAIKKGAARH